MPLQIRRQQRRVVRLALLEIGGLSFAHAITGCRSPATQIELFIDSDAPLNRPVQLRIHSFAGVVAPGELPSRAALAGAAGETLLTRDGAQMGGLNFGGSIGVLPVRTADTGPVTLWLRATVAATATSPEIRMERAARFQFVRGQRGTARIFFALRCGDAAGGCTTVSASECTVSVRCREQNATCGDQGECVAPEVPVAIPELDGAIQDVPSSVIADVTSGRLDSTVADVSPLDARVDGAPVIDVPELMDSSRSADADVSTDVGVPPDDADSSVLPPQLLFPQSVSRITGRDPDFQWTLAANTTGVQLVLCRDRACTMVIDRQSVNATHLRRGVELPADTIIYWKLRGVRAGVLGTEWSPTWEFRTPTVSAPRCVFAGIFADYNGDGLSDVAVSAVQNSSVYVFEGRAPRLSDTPGLTLRRAVVSYGANLAVAGDVNGDGFADLLVSAPQEQMLPGDRRGTVYLHLGSPTGLPPIAARVLFGFSNGARYGTGVAGVGDLNRDGFGDIVVGAPLESTIGPGRGAAFVYFGGLPLFGAAPTVIAGTNDNDELGRAIAAAADVNADGFADVIVGASGGPVGIYHGFAAGVRQPANRLLAGVSRTVGFGAAVAGVGDTNGDGYADIAVGAPSEPSGVEPNAGMTRNYLGSPMGVSAFPRAEFASGVRNDAFGSAISSGADINRDGLDDFIVGAPGRSAVNIYFGTAGGGVVFRDQITLNAATQMGTSVSLMPDCNGDGFVDVFVGAPADLDGMGQTAGTVSCYFTAPMLGVSPMRSQFVSAGGPAAAFGFALAN